MRGTIYTEFILDHYRKPRNRGYIKNSDFEAKEENVFCGDEIEISGSLRKSRIDDIKFRGRGCVISMAAGSILTDFAKGKTFEAAKKIQLQSLIKIMGLVLTPTRMKCAELPLTAFKKGLSGI